MIFLHHQAIGLSSAQLSELEKKNAYFLLETLHIFIPAFDTYLEAVEQSKFEVVVNTYKLRYLDYTSGATHCNSITNEDLKVLCPDLLPSRREQINVVDVKGAKEQAANKTVA
ncbi:unnamed protein product [Prunus armeniaca]